MLKKSSIGVPIHRNFLKGHSHNAEKDDDCNYSDDENEAQRKKRLEELNRFKMKPPCPDDYNEDGTLKFKP